MVSALAAWRQEVESLYPQLVQIPSGYYHSQVKKLEQLDAQKKRLNREAILPLQAKQPIASERVWKNILVKTGRGSKRLRQVISMGGSNGIFNLRPFGLQILRL